MVVERASVRKKLDFSEALMDPIQKCRKKTV